MLTLGEDLSEEEIDEMIREADEDGDGKVRHLEWLWRMYKALLWLLFQYLEQKVFHLIILPSFPLSQPC